MRRRREIDRYNVPRTALGVCLVLLAVALSVWSGLDKAIALALMGIGGAMLPGHTVLAAIQKLTAPSEDSNAPGE